MRLIGYSPRASRAWWASAAALIVCAGVLSVAGVSSGSTLRATSHVGVGTWTKEPAIVNGHGGVNAVSCATATFCVAVDRSGGASIFNGTVWGAPVNIDGSNTFSSISCPTTTFCVATDDAGNYVEWNNGSWAAPTPFASGGGPTMQAVSCSSVSFCLAVGRSANFSPVDDFLYNGRWYSDAVGFSPSDTNALTAVSCTSASVCVATDQTGGEITFSLNPASTPSLSHPPTTTAIDPGAHFASLSVACVAATSCVVGSSSNQIATLNGATWTTATIFPAHAAGVVVSCALSTCVATDSQGDAVSSLSPFTNWSAGSALGMLAQVNAISCYPEPASVACQEVDNDGFAISVTSTSAGAPTLTPASTFFDPLHALTSVACASATYCVAGDAAGETVTYRAGRWFAPRLVTALPLGVREVRCGASVHPYSSLQCAAVAGNFQALHLASFTAHWTAVPPAGTQTYAISCAHACEYLSPEGRSSGLVGGYIPKLPASAIVTDVSCPVGPSGCVAIDSSGDSYASGSGQWMAGPPVESVASRLLWSVSCSSASFCAAIDLSGHAYLFNGSTWSVGVKVSSLGLYALSCAAAYFCVATDLVGGAYVYNGTTWVATPHVSALGTLHGVSCASTTTCVAVDSTNAYRFVIPLDKTSISFAAARVAQDQLGHTVVMVSVKAAKAPSGQVTLSAGLSRRAPSCVAVLRKVDATSSRAHCTIATKSLGPTNLVASFAGSFGFAPTGPTRHVVTVTKR